MGNDRGECQSDIQECWLASQTNVRDDRLKGIHKIKIVDEMMSVLILIRAAI